mmetsp:Transcript_35131/g.114742  ORF Transcript_35131/g.114742 Transcript_35131/m.114742 type:complete len:221 (+) Transcript_35131:236-898(+)
MDINAVKLTRYTQERERKYGSYLPGCSRRYLPGPIKRSICLSLLDTPPQLYIVCVRSSSRGLSPEPPPARCNTCRLSHSSKSPSHHAWSYAKPDSSRRDHTLAFVAQCKRERASYRPSGLSGKYKHSSPVRGWGWSAGWTCGMPSGVMSASGAPAKSEMQSAETVSVECASAASSSSEKTPAGAAPARSAPVESRKRVAPPTSGTTLACSALSTALRGGA